MERTIARTSRRRGGWRRVGVAVLLSGIAAGALEAKDADFLGFFAGTYEIVGRAPGGGAAYTGTMTATVAGSHLRLARTIDGRQSSGTARIEERTADKIRILTFEIGPPDHRLEGWCAIGSDLDNGPRLTCLWRPIGAETARPGLEAWFWQDTPSPANEQRP